MNEAGNLSNQGGMRVSIVDCWLQNKDLRPYLTLGNYIYSGKWAEWCTPNHSHTRFTFVYASLRIIIGFTKL